LKINDSKLASFDADAAKFPHGLAGLASVLREQYNIPHVGVWHTFQGYWDGVDVNSDIGKAHKFFTGINNKVCPTRAMIPAQVLCGLVFALEELGIRFRQN
jgi:hypothetical protein